MNLLKQTIDDKGLIEDLIPQKAPFVMVDKLIYFSSEKVITGFTPASSNLFVDNNRFMATGLIEHMAQSVALHTGYQYYLKNEPAPTGYIGAIKLAEILDLPGVDQELITTVTILHDILGVTLVKIQVSCNGKIMANSEMKTVLAN
jgi:predicted hotdog family 3-hydroxylacyl-ACP dehydratase